MDYIENMEIFRKNAESPAGKELVGALHRDVLEISERFSDDPKLDSGWGHAYFCSEDGANLKWDISKPSEHVCPICGKVFSSGVYDGAWLYIYRYTAIRSAHNAAALYRLTGDTFYTGHIERILSFYADNYENFNEHGRAPAASGNGKITPQAPNEAIVLCYIAGALKLAEEGLRPDFVQKVKDKLLIPASYFLDAQKKTVHNIPCWINAGIGVSGLFCGDDELVARAFDRPLGLEHQVRDGITDDFFWYEGSILYNYFTIESFMNLMLFARLYGKEIAPETERKIYGMLLAPLKYCFSNGVFPNPNDGWPNVNIKTFSFLYAMAERIFDNDEIRAVCQKIGTVPVRRAAPPLSAPFYNGDYSLMWLMFCDLDPVQEKARLFEQSYNFESSSFAILRGENTEVFFKYGHRSSSHAHADKMNVEINAFGVAVTHDISNCGYAARLCNEYQRKSPAHNTVVIDGQSHKSTERGETLFYSPNKIAARYADAYPGVDFKREITLTANGLNDVFTVDSQDEHVIDWIFHVDGICAMPDGCEPSGLGFSDLGYQHLFDVMLVPAADELLLRWDLGSGIVAEQRLNTSGMEVFVAKNPANPANILQGVVVLRKKCTTVVFEQSFIFTKEN